MANFDRKLGLVEHLFATLHSMGEMLYVNIAKIQGELSLETLRFAIDLLQKRHPLLQVHLQKSDDGYYFCTDSTLAIPLKLINRPNNQQWIEVAQEELQQKFSGELEPLCRITLLQTPENPISNELIVTFHHAIADGISALHFIHELLLHYQKIVEKIPILPIETLPLHPPLEQLLAACLSEPMSVDFSPVAQSETSPPPTLIIEQTAPVNERQTRLISHEFSEVLTSNLKSRCRNEQTTVHGALCAAMGLVIVQHLGAQTPVTLACGSNVNLRAFCTPALVSDQLGCFVSNITTTHHTEQQTHFWELARECQTNIHQLVNHKIPHLQVSNAELINKYQPSFLAQLAEHNMGRTTTTHISNLGQFDFNTSYGSIQLESFHFATGQNLVGTCFWLGAVTVQQKLCCTFAYTEPLISMKTAKLLVDSVITILDSAAS
jgi:NRPS condensation-like uncharacterized protein